MLFLGINPELSDWVMANVKVFWYVVLARHQAMMWQRYRALHTAGAQYRKHVQSGGYRPC